MPVENVRGKPSTIPTSIEIGENSIQSIQIKFQSRTRPDTAAEFRLRRYCRNCVSETSPSSTRHYRTTPYAVRWGSNVSACLYETPICL